MFRLPTRLISSSVKCLRSLPRNLSSASVPSTTATTETPAVATELNKEHQEITKRLMSFFDEPANWQAEEVKSGRPWRLDELRIKSNEDLHRLWFVLLKERNMLMTMQEVAKVEVENMASPERIDKVEESMKNIEEVVLERNKAFWELEVGDSQYATRRRSFRRDIFGRWRWIACSEHLIPYWMNTEWRRLNAPGFGKDVIDFNRRLREKMQLRAHVNQFKTEFEVRQLLRRFPDTDLDVLRQKYPTVDIDHQRENLKEYQLKDRNRPFNDMFYKQQKKRLREKF